MKKTLVFAGSGTGGHIRPLIGVAHEIKKADPDINIVYVGQKRDKFASIVKDIEDIDRVKLIFAGKFRRYHGLGIKQFLHVPTLLRNFRDFFLVLIGLMQACVLMRRLKPKAVFIKGGFIGVPVGLAAARRKIPIVTHDSDAMPGLANRLIARWVDTHAVALPIENYNYPPEDTVQVGVPLSEEYYKKQHLKQEEARKDLGLEENKPTLLIFGGSLGAQRLNDAVDNEIDNLLSLVQVVHVTGHNNYADYDNNSRAGYYPIPFVDEGMYKHIIASDVVVSRAGATALSEISAIGKPLIIVPNPQLTGGHQLENAEVYAKNRSAIVISESNLLGDTTLLTNAVNDLLGLSEENRAEMAANQKKLIKPDSSKLLAENILDAMSRGR